ncbi:MAG: ROK family protein [Mycobacteriaceae bacterium]|nr:ROK family protein [Mycobacteriaceae bacterium]
MTSSDDPHPGQPGPAVSTAVDGTVLAIDVGGTTIKGEITAPDGTVTAAATVATPRGAAALDAVTDLGETLLSRLGDRARREVARAAVLLPGIVDAERGVAVLSANIGWRDVIIGGRWRDRWRVPTLLDHDTTVAGWAEWRYGAGAGTDTVCVVTIGTGVAAVLAVNRRLVRGSRGQAGEIGHVAVRPDGIACHCGNVGCVETVASAGAIAHAYTRRTGRRVDGAADVLGVLDHDPDARAVRDDAVEALADGLSGVIHAVCPQSIVLSGGLSEAGDAVCTPLQAALRRKLFVVAAPDVVAGAFGARAGLVGARELARAGSRDGPS